jgi:hypothetical protein
MREGLRNKEILITFVNYGINCIPETILVGKSCRKKPFLRDMGTKLNSVASFVRKRTIPTERPPLVGEVSANFCG